MATVADLSGNAPASLVAQGRTTDRPGTKHNRTNAGTPLAVLTPEVVGEIVLDTANGVYYYASGLTSSTWVPCSVGV